MKITRRSSFSFLAGTATATFGAGLCRALGQGSIGLSLEEQGGDPMVGLEILEFNEAIAERPLADKSRGPKKDSIMLADRMIEISKEFALAKPPVGRETAPDTVEQFLQLFDLSLKYPSGTYVPFCAAGVSFAACRAYCELDPKTTYKPKEMVAAFRSTLTDINKHYFKPSPAVRVIMADAKKRGTWIEPNGAHAKRGWLVVFSWKRNGVPNHVGIVERDQNDDSDNIETVEYNTSLANQSNGGTVAERTRKTSYVLGYVNLFKS